MTAFLFMERVPKTGPRCFVTNRKPSKQKMGGAFYLFLMVLVLSFQSSGIGILKLYPAIFKNRIHLFDFCLKTSSYLFTD